jgi:hypothetical protein
VWLIGLGLAWFDRLVRVRSVFGQRGGRGEGGSFFVYVYRKHAAGQWSKGNHIIHHYHYHCSPSTITPPPHTNQPTNQPTPPTCSPSSANAAAPGSRSSVWYTDPNTRSAVPGVCKQTMEKEVDGQESQPEILVCKRCCKRSVGLCDHRVSQQQSIFKKKQSDN